MLLLVYLLHLIQWFRLRYIDTRVLRHRAGWRKPSVVEGHSGRTRAKPQWVRDAIIRLAAHSPSGTGCRTLALRFNRRYAARHISVSKSYVNALLRAHRAEVAQLRERFKRHIPLSIARNAVWGIDLTGKRDVQDYTHSLLGILDHGSRRALCLRAVARKSSWHLLGHVCFAIAEFGKPQALRTDNEACFTSSVFRSALKLMGIVHQRTELGCPWQNGRIERLFGTLKAKLDVWIVANRAQLDETLTQFAYWYNTVRPHQHLDGRTPQEVWDQIDVRN